MYLDRDGWMYSRNRSYELAMMPVSLCVTREELADAKKELDVLRRRKSELLSEIEREKKERDERISADELQMIMFPVENVDRRIKELSHLICNARIVQEEPQETLIEEGLVSADQSDNTVENIEADFDARIPEVMFFVRDKVKVEAKPGNYTPFYASVNGEYMGFNRLILNGWVLVDDVNRHIEDISEAWKISKVMSRKAISKFIQSAKNKYPNAYSPWTAEENEKVVDLYRDQEKSIEEISEMLGRTKNGVSLQIKRLLGVDRLPNRKKQRSLDEYSLSPISITSINPSEIPDEKMPDYLDLIEQMEEWFKHVKDYANYQAIENGVYYKGYEIQTTLKNSFSDTKKVMDVIQEKFPNLFCSCVQLKTISSIRKTLGEENYNASIAELVEQKEQLSLKKSK